MPEDAATGLDSLTAQRGFANRSQCLTALVRDHLTAHAALQDESIMMGVLTLIYDHQKRDLQTRLTTLQHQYLKEIITIQLVHLEHQQTLQLLIVQGPARLLRQMEREMTSLKGVSQGRLQLSTHLLPPLHEPEPAQAKKSRSKKS